MEEMVKNEPQVLIGKIRDAIAQVIGKSRMLISFTGTEELYEKAVPVLKEFIETLPEGAPKGELAVSILGKKNEGFTDASAIQYVSRTGSFAKHGYKYSGYLNVLKMILCYDYLWMNVRVKGGAYGCSNSFYRTGEVMLSSYRDPNLRKTNEVYEGIPAYLRAFTADEREMTKYIIGTLGGMDTPMNPEAKGSRSLSAYLKNISEEEIQRERDEILSATETDIRALADMMEAVLADDNFCVIGNENNIRSEETMFMEIKSLLE
jgi:Zn-dependent M16 (insulinase) family peptidase